MDRLYSTTVEAVPASEEMAAPVVTYAFVAFEDLGAQIGGKTLFDVMGVVQTAGELGTVKRKSDGGELFRRDLTLLDANSKTVRIFVHYLFTTCSLLVHYDLFAL